LASALEFVAQLEVLPVTGEIAMEAARLGGKCDRNGCTIGNLDLVIGATVKAHNAILLSRDDDFSRIPGVAVERY